MCFNLVHPFFTKIMRLSAEWVFALTKQKKQNFVYGSTVLMASMIIVKLIGAVFKIPLTNILGLTGLGYFTRAYTVYTTIYALTVTGLSAAVARMVAENLERKRYRDVRKIFRLATLLFLILGVLGAGLIFFSAKGFSEMIKSPNSYWAIVMLAPAIFFCCMMASYRGYYEGLSNMTPTAVTQVVEVVAKLVAGLGFALIVMQIAEKQFQETGKVFGMAAESLEAAQMIAVPYGAAGAMLGVSVSTLVGLVYIYFRHKLKGDSITKEMLRNAPPSRRSKVLVYRLLKVALPVTLGAVVLQLSALIDSTTIQNRLDYCYSASPETLNSLYGSFLKENEGMSDFLFGIFSSCVTLFNLVPAFTNIFGKSALPNVTAAWTERDRARIKLNVESVIRVTMLVAAPMSMGMAFMAEPILKLLYSKQEGIESGAVLLAILAVASLFLALVTPMNAIIQGVGRMDLPVKYLFCGALTKLVLNVVLIGIPSINILGSSVSTLACYLLIAFLSINKLRKIVTVSLNYTGIFIKPLIAGLACGIMALLSYNLLQAIGPSRLITILSIGIGGLCYLLVLFVLKGIAREDVLMLPKGNKIAKTLEKLHIIR